MVRVSEVSAPVGGVAVPAATRIVRRAMAAPAALIQRDRVFHMDKAGVAHDEPAPQPVIHMDESGVGHDAAAPQTVMHMDESGVAHDKPQAESVIHMDDGGVGHDQPGPEAGLGGMLAGWSAEAIQAKFGGNTEAAAPNYNAAPLLKRDFSSNWFRAKDTLLKEHRGAKPTPADPESMKANAVMQGLHGLRALDMKETFEATRQEMKQMEPSIMLIEHLKQQRNKLREAVEDPSSSLYASGGPTSPEVLKAKEDLAKQRAALLAKKEEMLLKWGSAGSTTITSDIDSNPKGAYSVLTVRKFNEVFRRQGGGGSGWPFEPGTVYDINVYGQDYMGDWPPFDVTIDDAKEGGGKNWTMTTHQETPLGTDAAAEFTKYQEVMSYLHVLKYIDHAEALDYRITTPETTEAKAEGPEWASYKARIVGRTPLPEQRKELEENLGAAETKYIEFRKRLLDAQRIVSGGTADSPDALLTTMMAAPAPDKSAAKSSADIDDRLKNKVAPGKITGARNQSVQLGPDQKMIDGLSNEMDEYDLGVVAMTASNRIYEQMEIEVIKAREAFVATKARSEKHPPQAEQADVEQAGLGLKKAMVDALYFANEVYMTQGAVQFAVLFKQGMGKDARQSKDLHGGAAVNTSLVVPKELFLHSFTENVGDTLKELNHFHGDDVKGALDKSAKYMDRMMESAENLLGPQYEAALAQWPELKTLRDVASSTAEMKANVDLKGAAELRKASASTGAIEKVLAYMRLGETWESLQAALTEADQATLKKEEAAGKVDMAEIEKNWASRSLATLDAAHDAKRQTALTANTIPDAKALRALVIDFGAEVPKMYHKWLNTGGTKFDKTDKQRTSEAAAAIKPTTMDADIGKLEAAWRTAKGTAQAKADSASKPPPTSPPPTGPPTTEGLDAVMPAPPKPSTSAPPTPPSTPADTAQQLDPKHAT